MHTPNDTASSNEYLAELPDEAATLAFGAQLAQTLQAGLVIYLHGDLGAGKTTLTRGLLRGLCGAAIGLLLLDVLLRRVRMFGYRPLSL